MRFARVVAALLVLVPFRAHADALGRALHQPADPTGPGAKPAPMPPAPADDITTWAGPAQATSLPALLQLSVRQAPALASARIDIEIAEARIYQTYARGDWQLAAVVDASRLSGGTFFDRSLGLSFQTDPTYRVDGAVDVSRVLPTNGTLSFHTDSAYTRTTNATTGQTAKDWTLDASVSISQPLLRGRGRFYYEANELRATLSRDATVLAKRLAAIQTVQQVVSAYWDLVLAERQVLITRASLDLANERLRITKIGNEGGKVPRSEIPAVEQIIATREEEVLNNELAVIDRSIVLRRAVGMPIGKNELGLSVPNELTPGETKFELGELTERAFHASPELAQLAKQDQVTKLDIEVTENGLLPQLDLALTLGPSSSDTTFVESAKSLVSVDKLFVGGNLTLKHSIGQENVKGLAQEQRGTRKKIAVSAFDIRAQIAQSMARAVAGLELARRRVILSQRAIDLANENIKIETDRFNLGKATNFDVLNRQEELRQSELRKAQAIIDWHKAEAIVQALTGDILPAYGITVD